MVSFVALKNPYTTLVTAFNDPDKLTNDFLLSNALNVNVYCDTNIKINVTYNHQLSTIYLFGIISLKLTDQELTLYATLTQFQIIYQLYFYGLL